MAAGTRFNVYGWYNPYMQNFYEGYNTNDRRPQVAHGIWPMLPRLCVEDEVAPKQEEKVEAPPQPRSNPGSNPASDEEDDGSDEDPGQEESEAEEGGAKEFFTDRRLKTIGFILCLLSGVCIGLGISNIVITAKTVLDQNNSSNWNCLSDTNNPYSATLGLLYAPYMAVADWIWISVGMWAPVTIFVAGIYTGLLKTMSQFKVKIFLFFAIISEIIFIPVMIVFGILDAVLSNYCLVASNPAQPTGTIKFVLPVIVVGLAILEFLITLLIIVYTIKYREPNSEPEDEEAPEGEEASDEEPPETAPKKAPVPAPAPAPAVAPVPAPYPYPPTRPIYPPGGVAPYRPQGYPRYPGPAGMPQRANPYGPPGARPPFPGSRPPPMQPNNPYAGYRPPYNPYQGRSLPPPPQGGRPPYQGNNNLPPSLQRNPSMAGGNRPNPAYNYYR